MKNKKLLGSLLLTLTAMIWGAAFAFQRMGSGSVEPITFTASRMALACLSAGTAAFVFYRKRPKEESPERKRATLVGGICCGLFLAAASILQQAGLATTTAGKAGFITALYILLVPLVNLLLFRRRCPPQVWLAIAVGVVGMYLLCMTEGLRLARGDTMVCLCAFLFTGQILCCDHFARRGDPVRIALIQFLTVFLVSLVLALVLEHPSWEGIKAAAVPILYCGVMSAGVGYTLQMVAQGFTDPTVASLLMSMEAVFAVLGGAVLLRERMTGRELLGCIIMFAAIILVQLPTGKKAE